MSTDDGTIDPKAAKVRLVVLDADGVLTDGRIIVFADGNEARAFHARDGLAVKLGQRGGLAFAIVSGRRSPVVESRARELGFVACEQGVDDKRGRLRTLADRLGMTSTEVCYMGDDVVDLPALRWAGFSVAPADADPAVRARVDWVTPSGGGRGAVRETVEMILRSSGAWTRVAAEYHGGDDR